jgi:mRNA-degrading endonuclease RelE of RelBE toxin-antitoxin system
MQPSTEVCDNVDNNCDGSVDENLTRPTTCGAGECSGNTGEETCTAGTWGNDTCDPYAGAMTEGPPGDQTCGDTLDNDCDGQTDKSDSGCIAAPSLIILQPDGEDDKIEVGEPYKITYTLSDPDDIVTVRFYYARGDTAFGGEPIQGQCAAAPEGTLNTCTWDTTGVKRGTYYVYGITSDGTNTIRSYSKGKVQLKKSTTYYSPPNVPSSLSISKPDSKSDKIEVGDLYEITYTLSDPDDKATVSFYYDTGKAGLNGKPIQGKCATAPEGTHKTCTWDTTGVKQGTYYIYGITHDGTDTTSSYSKGTIQLKKPTTKVRRSSLSISQPDGKKDTIRIGDSYKITYKLSNPDNTVIAKFYYDKNNKGLDGKEISGECAAAPKGSRRTCTWDTRGVKQGNYYVYGVTDDGNKLISAYSKGKVKLKKSKDKDKDGDDDDDDEMTTMTTMTTMIDKCRGTFLRALQYFGNPYRN